METHVKVLGVLYLALSAIGVLVAVFLIVTLGSAAGIVGAAADAEDAAIAIPIIGITGVALVILLLCVSLPGVFAGWGLLSFRPWARILAIVLAIINLFNIPVGTLMGIYALWVLLNKETERLFAGAPRPAG
jgi:hypothetical protein